MGLFSRISDIISANINDLVDKFENPEKMLRQAVREMQTTIDQTRRSAATALADENLLAGELQRKLQDVELWKGRAQTAVADENDALARKALSRKHECEMLVESLSQQHASAKQTRTTLCSQLKSMEQKLDEANRRLGTLSARKRAADLKTKAATAMESSNIKGDAFAKFERMKKKVEQAEAQAEAMEQITKTNVTDLETVCVSTPVQDDFDVESELAEMKKRVLS